MALMAYPVGLAMGTYDKEDGTRVGPPNTRADGLPVPPAFERHFTIRELATLWQLSEDTVRRMFQGEPGVVEVGPQRKVYKRPYTTLRIPESVVVRVHKRRSLVSKQKSR